jgi:tRNA threonylcarbamoyladenosine biosynthesis protein TsaB
MLFLAWDTAAAALQLALVNFDSQGRREILGSYQGDGERSHSEVLAPKVQEILRASRLTLKDVDVLAAGCGPGSFTGLRVGLALAKGLALARNLPAIGISSLAAVAAQEAPGLTVPVIDARHREIFTALCRVSEPDCCPEFLSETAALSPGRLEEGLSELTINNRVEPLTCAGPGLPLLKNLPPAVRRGSEAGPQAQVLAGLAYRLWQEGRAHSFPLIPLYGRSPEIFQAWKPPSRLNSSSSPSK